MSTYNLKISQLEREREQWKEKYMNQLGNSMFLHSAYMNDEEYIEQLELAGLMMQDLLEIHSLQDIVRERHNTYLEQQLGKWVDAHRDQVNARWKMVDELHSLRSQPRQARKPRKRPKPSQ